MEGSRKAEPMRLALSGLSDTIIASDYRGVKVLAAYEPVGELDLGIVAKIDIKEIRRFFVRTAIIALVVGLGLIVIGGFFMLRAVNPLVKQLEENEKGGGEDLRLSGSRSSWGK